MKWIGQHIYDLVARFRDDVYLEDISDGTVDSSKFLGLDSDGKIVKQTVSVSVTDLHDAGVDGSNNQLLTDDGDGSITSESNLTFNGSTLGLTGDMNAVGNNYLWTSSTSFKPYLAITNTNSDANGSLLYFIKNKGAAGADGDDIASIYFNADNSAQEMTAFGLIKAEVATALDTDEAGKLIMMVMSSDGTTAGLSQAFTATGHGTNDTVDIGLGFGTASTTTIAGDLVVTGTIANKASQIVNLKGYTTNLQDGVYEYANPYNTDDEAPFQMQTSYGSGTIGSGTEVTQKTFFRSGGFHVPFACTISTIQVQATITGATSTGGNIVVAIAEYRPSDLGGDQNDYPRTVYEEVTVLASDNANKVKSTTIATGDLDATAIPAGSHLILMIKGDSDTASATAIVSASIGLSW